MKLISLAFIAGVVFAAGGCKKKAGGDDCTKAINHSMDMSRADMEKMGADAKTIQQLVDLGVQHCKDDKWSSEATKCMIDAKTMQDSQACYGKLTQQQQDTMNKAAMDMASAKAGSANAGSAAAGSDMAGSAAAGSDMAGSAAAGSAGSADTAGSAGSATGSADTAGSATGSGSATK